MSPHIPTRCLVISDLHISDVEEHPDHWKRFKSREHSVDEQLDASLQQFASQHGSGERLLLVFAGDVFDFDVTTCVPDNPSWTMRHREWTRGLEPSEEKAIWKLEQILQHHPGFVTALARWLGAGHDLVYVMGNHDRELHYDGVQQVLSQAVRAQTHALGSAHPEHAIRFEPWFFWHPDGLYVEHGHQYDIYSSFAHLLEPTVVLHGETILGLPLGGFSNRYLISVLGFFNPRSTDYICNAFGYFAHWRRFYAGTRRSALWGWLTGSAMVLVRVLGLRRHLAAQAPAHARRLARTAARYGLPVRTLETLDRAKPRPIAYNSFRILREYWLDRVALAFGLTVAAALFVLLGPLSAAPALLAAALVSAALVTAYEKLVATDGVFTVDREIKRYSDQIAKLLGAQVVVMGHTHRPSLERLPGGAAFVNTGTWAPMYTWRSLDQAHPGYRNTLQVLLAPDRIELDLCSADPGPQDRPSSVVLLRQAVAEDPESPSAFIAGG